PPRSTLFPYTTLFRSGSFFPGTKSEPTHVGCYGSGKGRIGAVDFRREPGARARAEGECGARIELCKPADVASRAASSGVEHRPQHHQPCGERRFGQRGERNARAHGGLSWLNKTSTDQNDSWHRR